jgi:hypothetical protein
MPAAPPSTIEFPPTTSTAPFAGAGQRGQGPGGRRRVVPAAVAATGQRLPRLLGVPRRGGRAAVEVGRIAPCGAVWHRAPGQDKRCGWDCVGRRREDDLVRPYLHHFRNPPNSARIAPISPTSTASTSSNSFTVESRSANFRRGGSGTGPTVTGGRLSGCPGTVTLGDCRVGPPAGGVGLLSDCPGAVARRGLVRSKTAACGRHATGRLPPPRLLPPSPVGRFTRLALSTRIARHGATAAAQGKVVSPPAVATHRGQLYSR